MAAAILQLRRGTSPSSTISEPYFNTSLGTLQIGTGSGYITLVKIGSNTGNLTLLGNLSVSGTSIFTQVTGSSLYITGDTRIDGDLRLGGTIFLGSGSDGDLISVNASLSGSLIPDTTDVYDLGTESYKYKNLYVLTASIDNVLLPGSGILSSSNENFTDFSESVDGRLDNIESFTASQEDLNGTFATTGSNTFVGDQTISGSIDVSGTIKSQVYLNPKSLDGFTVPDGYNAMLVGPVDINGDITLEGDSNLLILDKITLPSGLLSSSVTDFDTFSASIDDRIENIQDIGNTYATTGSNIFIGNQTITGSIFMSGSRFEAKVSWPSVGTQYHLFEPEQFTISGLESGSRTYGYNAMGMEHYEEGISYHNSVLFHFWSSSNFTDPTNYGSELNFGPLNSFFRIWPSGSDLTIGENAANISVTDLQNGTTRANIYANEVHLGAFRSDIILIGNPSSYINIKGTGFHVETDVTASFFVGDGSKLQNITASYVEYDNVVNKPTLVSGSTQIDVNDTQNFQTYSSSVDSRLDIIEGDLSSSINSQLESIHQYTSSLKQAIDVSGEDLTVYGNLTVQGTTTTLNTTELIIEDKLLALASGSTTSAEADGAGLYISGADASMLWDDTNSNLVFNQKVSSSVGFKGDGSELTGVTAESVDFHNITNKPTLVSGSAQITSSLDFRYLEINGDEVVSGSSQIIITDTTGFTTFSGSLKTTDDGQNSRLNNLELTSQSHDNRISQLESDSGSQDGRLDNLELFTSSQETLNSFYNSYTESNDTNISKLYNSASQYQSFSESIDSIIKNKIDLEGVVSSSSDTSTISLSINSGVISGVVIGGIVSGSDQLTSSLDTLYEVSGSVAQLVGIHAISGSLGSAAWYNVSASISDGNPQVLGNAGAVKAYIDEALIAVGAGDITKVTAGLGMSGSTDSGEAVVAIDTASAHFNEGVQHNLVSLNLYTQSNDTNQSIQDGRLDNLELFTESLDTLYVSEADLIALSSSIIPLETNYFDLGSATKVWKDLYISTSSIKFVDGTTVVKDLNLQTLLALENASSSYLIDSESFDSRIDLLESFSSSLDGGFVTEIELSNATSSLIDSIATKLDTGSYLVDSASFDNRIDTLEGTPFENPLTFADSTTIDFTRTVDSITANVVGGILSSSNENFTQFSSSVDDRLDSLESFSSSLDTTFVTQAELAIATGALEDADSLQRGRLDNIEGFTSSIDTTIKTKMDADGVLSGSSQVLNGSGILSSSNETFTDFSSSVDNRLDLLESNSSSLDTLYEEKASGTHTLVSGSSQLTSSYDNRYVTLDGDQTINGTKTFNDIVVNGTGSFAYITSVSGTAKIVGDSYIILNNDTPTQRYAGIAVYDSGSATPTTASFNFDGQTNDWFYEYSSSTVDYGVALFGPEYTTKGNPTYLTTNTIPKAEGTHHLNDSNISDSGTLITLNSNTQVNGNLVVNGNVSANNLISGSSQVTLSGDITGTADNNQIASGVIVNTDVNASAGIVYTKLNLEGSGIVSGAAQIDTLGFLKVDGDGVVSGSTQITKSLQDVTSVGNTTNTTISITNSTASTSNTTGALVVTGGVGIGGSVFAGGDVVAYASSDRRLKDEITPIENPLQKINQIGGYSFVWNEEKQNIYKGKDYGVIAQEIEQILPELVENRENGYKAVKYDKLVSLLIEGIKDLSSQVEELRQKINKG